MYKRQDISKIQLGQSVDVVADALEDQVFVGTITQIIQEGESQNGVTTYPVEVVIDTPGDLMIGMNVTATVIVAVSYTHLDVYKRQRLSLTKYIICASTILFEMSSSIPGSKSSNFAPQKI